MSDTQTINDHALMLRLDRWRRADQKDRRVRAGVERLEAEAKRRGIPLERDAGVVTVRTLFGLVLVAGAWFCAVREFDSRWWVVPAFVLLLAGLVALMPLPRRA